MGNKTNACLLFYSSQKILHMIKGKVQNKKINEMKHVSFGGGGGGGQPKKTNIFLASQDALEVMRVTHSLSY